MSAARLEALARLEQEAPSRIFRAWVEDWELSVRTRPGPEIEVMLLQKYRGVRFRDPVDNSLKVVYGKNAEYFKRNADDPPEETWGWHLLGHDPDVDPEADPHCCFKAYDLEIVVESMLETGQDMDLWVLEEQMFRD